MTEAAQTLVLEVVGGGGEIPVPAKGVLVVGSSKERAGFVLGGQGVADVHCAVGRTKDGAYAVKDLGSDHGTLVNGRRVRSARLSDGDQIAIGSRRLRVRTADAAQADAGAQGSKRDRPQRDAARARASALPSIPGYRIERRLGRGAMGEVYLAVQESLDRRVALKVLDRRLASDADFVRRFQAEARAAAALHHPNVVTVFDVGAARDVHYLTMEFMDQGSLEDRLKRDGRVPPSEVLRLLHDAASGLVYAESKGIVHRDIKPDNLMRNHQGTTKIADLGLATQVEAEAEEVAAGGGAAKKIFGTPHFISPEQVRGDRADCRSDLYSLGATAYRLLSGATPYEGETTREILRAKLTSDPVPLDERVPELDAGLAAVVERSMQRDPADRYPSAGALLAELERLRSGAPPQLPAGGTRGTLVKGLVGVGAILVVATIAVLATRGGDGDPAPGPSATDPDGTERDGTGLAGSGDGDADAAGDGPRAGDATADADGNGTESAPIDDDAAERLFEIEAENALLRLESQALTQPELRDRLRALAEEYKGTTAATEALERADALESQILAAEREAAEESRAVNESMAQLRAAAALDDRPVTAADALRAMAAVPNLDLVAGSEAFETRRAALEREVWTLAVQDLEDDLARADAARAEGDFLAARDALAAALARTEIPEEVDATGDGAQRVLELRDALRARLDDLDDEKDRWIAARARRDAATVAEAVRGPSGLEDELRRFDFEAASTTVAELRAAVGSPDLVAWLDALAADLEGAGNALDVLVDDWKRWRRVSVTDPRGRRTYRDAVGATTEGLRLAVDGDVELVPWSAFAGRTEDLGTLFRGRLDRDYTEDERRAIGALMTLSAVIETASTVERMFAPDSNAKFHEREADQMLAAFDIAREWLTDGEPRQRWLREREAARWLADALIAASDERWPDAVALLGRLTEESKDSLLVRLFSDGSALAPPEDD